MKELASKTDFTRRFLGLLGFLYLLSGSLFAQTDEEPVEPFIEDLTETAAIVAPDTDVATEDESAPEEVAPEDAAAKASPASTKPAAPMKAEDVVLGIDEKLDGFMAPISKAAIDLVFVGQDDVGRTKKVDKETGEPKSVNLPLVVIWLAAAAIILTLSFGFINLWGLPLAFKTIRGKLDQKDAPGEVTHFQALSAAISATVGLGNIAGVAIAVELGGPGAVFWMIVVGFLGMTTKFAECTLGVKYRVFNKKGKVFGGPMYYLRDGLKERDMKGLGRALAVLFAIMCAGAALGGGNMFQINQLTNQVISKFDQASVTPYETSKEIRAEMISISSQAREPVVHIDGITKEPTPLTPEQEQQLGNLNAQWQSAKEDQSYLSQNRWIIGASFAFLVGLVIIGGIKSIGRVAGILVPFMCGLYIIACLTVIVMNSDKVAGAFTLIWTEAFNLEAGVGVIIGAFIIGIRRAAFSNEAGFGSAPIAHAAVKTKHPASEGLVALLEPLVDTVIVCTMTALVILCSGAYDPEFLGKDLKGIELTADAFQQGLGPKLGMYFSYVLTASVVLFAFSTMISWSYYGQQAFQFLFGRNAFMAFVYKVIFCAFIVVGASASLDKIIDFSDAMLFGMCLFNLIGVYMLLPVVRRELKSYRAYNKQVKYDRKHGKSTDTSSETEETPTSEKGSQVPKVPAAPAKRETEEAAPDIEVIDDEIDPNETEDKK